MTNESDSIAARAAAPWVRLDDGATLGQRGSEGGVILLDDEHPAGARITLEATGYPPFAITCGVYGSMVHTRFLGTEEGARREVEAMKPRLALLAASVPYVDEPDAERRAREVAEACSRFAEEFP
ncbi:MAG: hypothetical protein IPJ17_05385 [Holophagales bacterium]|nr:MAG: hypothetical protein IPJ17_05385 [Holophagales bacterium]